MIPDEIAFASATTMAAQIRERKIGSLELLDHMVARIERFNPQVNAVVAMDLDRARQQAKAADQRHGELPLHGVPMTVKESFNVTGLPTTLGLPAYRDNIASRNALAVDRITAAGAIVFGKTNVPPWLADSQSTNPVYGRTANPWAPDRTPGGSSGGAAAALATGMTGLEMGSDIAGSLRNPASYCGVLAHKPTYGLCPARGHGLGERIDDTDISVIGPMARNADDLATALQAIAGPDETTARAYRLTLPPPRDAQFGGKRIAVVLNDPIAEVDATVSGLLEATARFLEQAGATVSFTARPEFDHASLHAIYTQMVRAATSGRQSDAEFEAACERVRTGPIDPNSYAGKTLLGNTMSHRTWIRLNEQRHGFRVAWNRFFADYDLLLCPICVTGAFPQTTLPNQDRVLHVNGRDVDYGDQFFWSGYGGLAYLPATVAPVGLTPDGLPVGVQIIGAQYDDLSCIAMARFIGQHHYAFTPPPGYA